VVPEIGDLALYRLPKGPYVHVGIVYGKRKLTADSQPIPWVLSKLNDHFGEAFHPAGGWTVDDTPCEVEYWTDRYEQTAKTPSP